MSKSKILVGLTGSIACYKTCSLISQLVQEGHEVRVVATPNALKFVGEATLEGLTKQTVLSDNFTSAHMIEHITLARWADIFIVAPITANHLNKFSLGLADDLLTTLYLAYENHKPLYLAPAMNSVMYAHETVQQSISQLKRRGAKILEPTSGLLACGETGPGKMIEPEHIIATIFSNNKKYLITFGGTREVIDGVRSITNISTGFTGAKLTDLLTQTGNSVTALMAQGATQPNFAQKVLEFIDHDDLQNKMQHLLKSFHFDFIIHLAAVSDFSVDKIVAGTTEFSPSRDIKIGSEKSISLKLKINTKIVDQIKTFSQNKNIKVVAFKLTNTRDRIERSLAVEKLMNSPGVDFVVHNDLNEINHANNTHPFHIYGHGGYDHSIQNIKELAINLEKLLAAAKTSARTTISRFEVQPDTLS
ncbi:MAG: hypothetical protein A2Z20_12130 [Bdellovibrionales bacterium RBG_16_40_8]|nr:MAG: hypothetical protein A2Z20_12130 [Bdellovibrionales bacterium RBG_16_40_8]